MIKFRTVALFLILVVILLNSCEKEAGHAVGAGSTTTGSTNSSYYITFKVDGVAKSAVSSVSTIYQSGNTLQIIGQLAGTDLINLSTNNVAVGTFDIVTTNAILSYSTVSTYTDTWLGLSGSLTVTALTSDTITGTFAFTATNTGSTTSTKVITEGAFKCKYIKI
jgi:hypothetical protein